MGKQIVVSEETYAKLKSLRSTGQTFNGAISDLIDYFESDE